MTRHMKWLTAERLALRTSNRILAQKAACKAMMPRIGPLRSVKTAKAARAAKVATAILQNGHGSFGIAEPSRSSVQGKTLGLL